MPVPETCSWDTLIGSGFPMLGRREPTLSWSTFRPSAGRTTWSFPTGWLGRSAWRPSPVLASLRPGRIATSASISQKKLRRSIGLENDYFVSRNDYPSMPNVNSGDGGLKLGSIQEHFRHRHRTL